MRTMIFLIGGMAGVVLTGSAGAPADAASDVGSAIVVAAAARGAAAQDTTAARPLKIVALGDSLTSGHRLGVKDAYPAVLQQLLREAGVPATVINHGVSSDTTARGLERLDAALGEKPDILIVALGANDGLRGVPVHEVRRNVETIVERAQAAGAAVLLCGMEALPIGGWQYTLDFHRIFPDMAAKYDVPLVPFLLAGVIGNRALMSPDGIHPNAAGARVIAENIYPYLEPLARAVLTSRAA